MAKNNEARLRTLEDRAGLHERGSVYTFIKISLMTARYYMIFPEHDSPRKVRKATDWNPPDEFWWSMWIDDDAYERVIELHGRYVNSRSDETVRAEVREQLQDFHPHDHYGWGDKTMRQIEESWGVGKRKRKECRESEADRFPIPIGVIRP